MRGIVPASGASELDRFVRHLGLPITEKTKELLAKKKYNQNSKVAHFLGFDTWGICIKEHVNTNLMVLPSSSELLPLILYATKDYSTV